MRSTTLHRSRSAVAALAVAGGLAAAPAAFAAHRLPGVLEHDSGPFAVRPTSIYPTGDNSGVEGVLRRNGAQIEHGPGRGSLRWTSWSSQSATAVGTQWIKLSTPTATSPWTRQAVHIDLSRVRAGHFTRMVVHFRRQVTTWCLTPPYRGAYHWGGLYGGRCQ